MLYLYYCCNIDRGSADKGVLGRLAVRDDEGFIHLSEATPTAITKFYTAQGDDEQGDVKIVEIAAGANFSLLRSLDGKVYITGSFKDEDAHFKFTLLDNK